MAKKTLIKNATIVNEGKSYVADVLIEGPFIAAIGQGLSSLNAEIIDAEGMHLLPGCIDDQVHFREPGLTHKADIYTESMAAVAGGVTSFMEMPNTNPAALTKDLLEQKYNLANGRAFANYSFYMGASNTNLDQVLSVNYKNVCGIKAFFGSSTGDMLMDDEQAIHQLFKNAPAIVAAHCEDENTVNKAIAAAKLKYGEDAPASIHEFTRSEEACYLSSSSMIKIAKEYNARFHVLHITTAKELDLFEPIPLAEKRITAEACVHHLWYTADDYATLGNKIKCNPSIKNASHREALLKALNDGRIDVIATDHAPHTIEEKAQPYFKAPSGLPLIQFTLPMMLEHVTNGTLSIERVVELMAHNVATLFNVKNRGYIREGYNADLVLVKLNRPELVVQAQLYYKCAWSPLEGTTLHNTVVGTFVNGHLTYINGQVIANPLGERLEFKTS